MIRLDSKGFTRHVDMLTFTKQEMWWFQVSSILKTTEIYRENPFESSWIIYRCPVLCWILPSPILTADYTDCCDSPQSDVRQSNRKLNLKRWLYAWDPCKLSTSCVLWSYCNCLDFKYSVRLSSVFTAIFTSLLVVGVIMFLYYMSPIWFFFSCHFTFPSYHCMVWMS